MHIGTVSRLHVSNSTVFYFCAFCHTEKDHMVAETMTPSADDQLCLDTPVVARSYSFP